MMFALGAATSLFDTLQSLTASNSSSASSATQSQTAANPFQLVAGTQTSATPNTGFSSGTSGYSAISPQTMSALLDAQSQSGTTSSTTTTSPSDALQNLFKDIDSDGDGSITKSEFESALGAGGTNTAAADKVFGELDSNGDGTISLSELKSALQGAGGHHGGHHHMHASASAGSTDSSSADPSTDPLAQALAAGSTSNGSSVTGDLTSSLAKVDKSQLQAISLDASGTVNSSAYDMIKQALARAEQTFAQSTSASLSVSA